MELSAVPLGYVSAVLPAVLPYLQESAHWTRGRAGVDDLLQMIFTGKMQLWVALDGSTIHGHVITEVKQYPQCKMLAVQYCAMTPGTLDSVEDTMQGMAARFARDMGCAGIEFVGRPGWRTTARKYGYEVQSVTYQKFFEAEK